MQRGEREREMEATETKILAGIDAQIKEEKGRLNGW